MLKCKNKNTNEKNISHKGTNTQKKHKETMNIKFYYLVFLRDLMSSWQINIQPLIRIIYKKIIIIIIIIRSEASETKIARMGPYGLISVLFFLQRSCDMKLLYFL